MSRVYKFPIAIIIKSSGISQSDWTYFSHLPLSVLSHVISPRPVRSGTQNESNQEQCFICSLIPNETKFSPLTAAACSFDPTVAGESPIENTDDGNF